MDDAKLHEILAALLDEMRQSKVQMSDVLAQRSEYAADIRELKASIDITRRALDPEALGAHVADNIDEVMGDSVQRFAKGIHLNLDAAKANLSASDKTSDAAQNIKDHADKLNMERNALANIAERLEERDARSKWDWAKLAAAMIVAAALAGAGAFYYTKANIKAKDFNRSITFINQGKDDYWCKRAGSRPIQDNANNWFCPIAMGEFQGSVEEGAE